MSWPNIKLGQATKAFGYMVPTLGAAVGIGFLYDAPLLGQGMKGGIGTALVINAIFFLVIMFVELDKKYGNGR